jgi:hypothetical protein
VYFAAFVRGLALMRTGDPRGAAEAFRSARERKAQLPASIASVASVSLGHALAAAGDVAGARDAYQYFFELWERADPDVPLLVQARKEFESLK